MRAPTGDEDFSNYCDYPRLAVTRQPPGGMLTGVRVKVPGDMASRTWVPVLTSDSRVGTSGRFNDNPNTSGSHKREEAIGIGSPWRKETSDKNIIETIAHTNRPASSRPASVPSSLRDSRQRAKHAQRNSCGSMVKTSTHTYRDPVDDTILGPRLVYKIQTKAGTGFLKTVRLTPGELDLMAKQTFRTDMFHQGAVQFIKTYNCQTPEIRNSSKYLAITTNETPAPDPSPKTQPESPHPARPAKSAVVQRPTLKYTTYKNSDTRHERSAGRRDTRPGYTTDPKGYLKTTQRQYECQRSMEPRGTSKHTALSEFPQNPERWVRCRTGSGEAQQRLPVSSGWFGSPSRAPRVTADRFHPGHRPREKRIAKPGVDGHRGHESPRAGSSTRPVRQTFSKKLDMLLPTSQNPTTVRTTTLYGGPGAAAAVDIDTLTGKGCIPPHVTDTKTRTKTSPTNEQDTVTQSASQTIIDKVYPCTPTPHNSPRASPDLDPDSWANIPDWASNAAVLGVAERKVKTLTVVIPVSD